MNTMLKRTYIIVILSAALLLAGCARLRLQLPSVTVVSINVIEASLFEQKFAFKLRIQNPNDMDISITSMSFEIKLNDQPFAQGMSDKPVNLPRSSETMIEVTAISDLVGVIRQINELRKGNLSSVSYFIKGQLVTGSFPDLNFENNGMIDIPMPAKDR